MTLPFEPETEGQMRLRFAEAMSVIYEVDTVGGKRPGLKRKHVFDFFDGMRLIISRDKFKGEVCLHVSASFFGERKMKGEELVRTVLERVKDMRGGEGNGGTVLAFESVGGVAHFVFPEGGIDASNFIMPPHPLAN
jgi:hypothetical protein